MDTKFWHQRWENNDTGFHESIANPLLVRYFSELNLLTRQRVFLPLCGKTSAILWLKAQGCQVCGVELSEMAIQQLFTELDIEPEVRRMGQLLCYSADGLMFFVGDIFQLNADQLGQIDAVYDRAALVALPESVRQKYTAHLRQLTGNATQLLICFEYDQNAMPGPPFAISMEEVTQHYAKYFHIKILESIDIEGGLKGQCEALERVYLLRSWSDA